MDDLALRLRQHWESLSNDLSGTDGEIYARQLADNAELIAAQGRFWWEIKRRIPECSADFKAKTSQQESESVLKWGCNFMGLDEQGFLKSIERIRSEDSVSDLWATTIYHCSGNSFATPYASIGSGIIKNLDFRLEKSTTKRYKIAVDTHFLIKDLNLWKAF